MSEDHFASRDLSQAASGPTRLSEIPADVLANRVVSSLIMLKGNLNRYDQALQHFIEMMRAEAAEDRAELERIVEVVLACDREALADHRPKWGLADCVDNTGKPYQSQYLADALEKARSLVGAMCAEPNDRTRDAENPIQGDQS